MAFGQQEVPRQEALSRVLPSGLPEVLKPEHVRALVLPTPLGLHVVIAVFGGQIHVLTDRHISGEVLSIMSLCCAVKHHLRQAQDVTLPCSNPREDPLQAPGGKGPFTSVWCLSQALEMGVSDMQLAGNTSLFCRNP